MLERPPELNLSNWRQPGNNRWAFHHVREVVPSVSIPCAGNQNEFLVSENPDISQMSFEGLGQEWSLQQWLAASNSDALLIAHKGEIIHEWYLHDAIETSPHIVFSVSKSITAILAGMLVDRGLLDTTRLITDYIPELAESGFRGASLQHLLDMTIDIDFEEDYEATEGKFIEYRTATAWHPCEIERIDQNLHDFLKSLKSGNSEHGKLFDYKSPNSDLLGWVLECIGGEPFAQLFSRLIWQPLGAEADAYVTVDRKGSARSAGGLCVLPRDMLRFGEMVRNRGYANGQQVVSKAWIDECSNGGERDAWIRSESSARFPDGNYRNKWYQTGNAHHAMAAIGIHSQWIYIDPVAEVTIIKLSAQDSALNPELGPVNLRVFRALCDAL